MVQLLWIKSHKCHNPIFSRYQLMFSLQRFFLSQMFLDHENWFFSSMKFSFLKLLLKIYRIVDIYYVEVSQEFLKVETHLFINLLEFVFCLILNFNVKIFVLLIYIVNHISLSARRKLENEYPYTRGGN